MSGDWARREAEMEQDMAALRWEILRQEGEGAPGVTGLCEYWLFCPNGPDPHLQVPSCGDVPP